MLTINIRKQGGAAIITIPAEVLKTLDIKIGSTLELQVTDGAFTARPAQRGDVYWIAPNPISGREIKDRTDLWSSPPRLKKLSTVCSVSLIRRSKQLFTSKPA